MSKGFVKMWVGTVTSATGGELDVFYKGALGEILGAEEEVREQLDNLETKWKTEGKSVMKDYNLDRGRYRFVVQAKKNPSRDFFACWYTPVMLELNENNEVIRATKLKIERKDK